MLAQEGTHAGEPHAGIAPSGKKAEWTAQGAYIMQNGKIKHWWKGVCPPSLVLQKVKSGRFKTGTRCVLDLFAFVDAHRTHRLACGRA